MSSYFDDMAHRIADLKEGDFWDAGRDLEIEMVNDVTVCAMFPGFPSDLKQMVHTAILQSGICTLPSNAEPRDFATDEEHRALLRTLCSNLHSIFHEVAHRATEAGQNDHPHAPLRQLSWAGEAERVQMVEQGTHFLSTFLK